MREDYFSQESCAGHWLLAHRVLGFKCSSLPSALSALHSLQSSQKRRTEKAMRPGHRESNEARTPHRESTRTPPYGPIQIKNLLLLILDPKSWPVLEASTDETPLLQILDPKLTEKNSMPAYHNHRKLLGLIVPGSCFKFFDDPHHYRSHHYLKESRQPLIHSSLCPMLA